MTELLTDNLFVFHAFMASMTGSDTWKIDKEEAQAVGEAANNVSRHYDLPGVTRLTADWINLARVLGMVYGTRLFAWRADVAAKARAVPKMPDEPKAAVMANGSSEQREAPKEVWASPGPGLPQVRVTLPQ